MFWLWDRVPICCSYAYPKVSIINKRFGFVSLSVLYIWDSYAINTPVFATKKHSNELYKYISSIAEIIIDS